MEKAPAKPIILNGRDVANEVLKDIQNKISNLINTGKRKPGLAVILIGNNLASKTYVNNKEKTTKSIGINSQVYKLPAETTEKELTKLIERLNNSNDIDGILVQMPLPAHLKFEKIINCLNPEKDVDGLHPTNIGKLLIGEEGLRPCTPIGIIEILKYYSINIKGKHVVIIGRSVLVGKPLALLFLLENATVTIVHSKSENINNITKTADILISATGKPGLVKTGWVKHDAIVIDVGINNILENGKNKLVGDVDFENVSRVCKAITPVPGGVGPVTIAMLVSNTLKAYKMREKEEQ